MFGVKEEQFDNFVGKIKTLLGKAGDGIDFDFEHLSSKDGDELRKTQANLIHKVRMALDDAGMKDKTIDLTTRYNSAWDSDSIPDGWTSWNTDGEAVTMNKEIMDKHNTTLSALINSINIMFYDQSPDDLNAGDDGHIMLK